MPDWKMVVGLGNPGPKYEGTRHNIGFTVIDRLAAGGRGQRFVNKFDGRVAEIELAYQRILLLKPETFMNLSGRCVSQASRFYQLDPAQILVVCDDLTLSLGKLRLRRGGSDGGQKGLRDIIAALGTPEFPRLRIGIGERGQLDAADFVLSRFRPGETPVIEDALITATQAVAVWVSQGLDAAMNRFNASPTPANESATSGKDKAKPKTQSNSNPKAQPNPLTDPNSQAESPSSSNASDIGSGRG